MCHCRIVAFAHHALSSSHAPVAHALNIGPSRQGTHMKRVSTKVVPLPEIYLPLPAIVCLSTSLLITLLHRFSSAVCASCRNACRDSMYLIPIEAWKYQHVHRISPHISADASPGIGRYASGDGSVISPSIGG